MQTLRLLSRLIWVPLCPYWVVNELVDGPMTADVQTARGAQAPHFSALGQRD